MVQYPIRMQMPKAKPADPQFREAKPITQRDLDRHARMQGEEAKESKVMKKAKGGMMGDKAGRALKKKSADTMGRAMMKKAGGGKCYAKGGSIDGIAKKGKTKGKMC